MMRDVVFRRGGLGSAGDRVADAGDDAAVLNVGLREMIERRADANAASADDAHTEGFLSHEVGGYPEDRKVGGQEDGRREKERLASISSCPLPFFRSSVPPLPSHLRHPSARDGQVCACHIASEV